MRFSWLIFPVNHLRYTVLSQNEPNDSIFVDYVIRDIIERYGIENEDLWIQSNNVSSQYKKKHAFVFYQKLAHDFGLRIIRRYGASGHGKGAIDGMSSFGVENILKHDIIIQDIFFNDSETIVNYLAQKSQSFLTRMFLPWKWQLKDLRKPNHLTLKFSWGDTWWSSRQGKCNS